MSDRPQDELAVARMRREGPGGLAWRDYSGTVCPCGSAWFDATVTFEEGHVTGYLLPLRCHDCRLPAPGTEIPPTIRP